MKRNLLILNLALISLLISKAVFSQMDSINKTEIDTSIYTQIDTNSIIKKNTVFVEIGGNALIYSINYDRLFDVSERLKIAARIGVHFTNKFPLQYYRTICIPLEVSGMYLIYRSKHFVEIGSGLSYLNSYDRFTDHTEDILIIALRLGYRYQKPEGGLFVKIGFVPLYDWIVINPDPSVPHHSWFLSGGLGIGYTF